MLKYDTSIAKQTAETIKPVADVGFASFFLIQFAAFAKELNRLRFQR